MGGVEKRKILDDIKKKRYPLETSEVKKSTGYGRELEEGFVNAPRGIYWDTEEQMGHLYFADIDFQSELGDAEGRSLEEGRKYSLVIFG